jgi:transposase
MEPIYERVAGIDVHRMKHVVTVLISGDGGAVSSETREFGGFKRDMRALVDWLRSHRIQQVVMESTGIYWKSVFSHLEAAEIPTPPRQPHPALSSVRSRKRRATNQNRVPCQIRQLGDPPRPQEDDHRPGAQADPHDLLCPGAS